MEGRGSSFADAVAFEGETASWGGAFDAEALASRGSRAVATFAPGAGVGARFFVRLKVVRADLADFGGDRTYFAAKRSAPAGFASFCRSTVGEGTRRAGETDPDAVGHGS